MNKSLLMAMILAGMDSRQAPMRINRSVPWVDRDPTLDERIEDGRNTPKPKTVPKFKHRQQKRRRK